MKYIICLLSLFLCIGETYGASKISRGESITLTIKGVPHNEQVKISGEYVIGEDGMLHIPFIEGVRASGVSSSSLARTIEKAYMEAEVYTAPRISIVTARDKAETQTFAQKFVTVGGKVRRPGAVPYQEGMTLLQAIMQAGDANEFGAMNRVELMRGNQREVYNLKDPRSKSRNIKVRPNDTITIPQRGIFE